MDLTDKKIIETLQKQGRITNLELAKTNDLAPSSMIERVRRLEDRGIIKGYRAMLDPKKLGYNIEAIVMLCLNRHQSDSIENFEKGIEKVSEVKACFHIAGRYDYILYLALRDIEHLGELVKHRLGAFASVEKQETFLVLSTVKEDMGYSLIPLEETT